jgi:hypothetical protein
MVFWFTVLIEGWIKNFPPNRIPHPVTAKAQ